VIHYTQQCVSFRSNSEVRSIQKPSLIRLPGFWRLPQFSAQLGYFIARLFAQLSQVGFAHRFAASRKTHVEKRGNRSATRLPARCGQQTQNFGFYLAGFAGLALLMCGSTQGFAAGERMRCGARLPISGQQEMRRQNQQNAGDDKILDHGNFRSRDGISLVSSDVNYRQAFWFRPNPSRTKLRPSPRAIAGYENKGNVQRAYRLMRPCCIISRQQDERGNKSYFKYDLAGRQIEVKDALNRITTTTYDDAGQRKSITDAFNRTTLFVYDGAGRMIETIYPDPEIADTDDTNNPRVKVGYDVVGRKVIETDEMGRITRFSYDLLGRLTQVILPNPSNGQNPPLVDGVSPSAAGTLVTKYEYDEQGNKTAQIDAEGRRTAWSFDEVGRNLTRALPMGQVESNVHKYLYAGANPVMYVDPSGNMTLGDQMAAQNGLAQLITTSFNVVNFISRVQSAMSLVQTFWQIGTDLDQGILQSAQQYFATAGGDAEFNTFIRNNSLDALAAFRRSSGKPFAMTIARHSADILSTLRGTSQSGNERGFLIYLPTPAGIPNSEKYPFPDGENSGRKV